MEAVIRKQTSFRLRELIAFAPVIILLITCFEMPNCSAKNCCVFPCTDKMLCILLPTCLKIALSINIASHTFMLFYNCILFFLGSQYFMDIFFLFLYNQLFIYFFVKKNALRFYRNCITWHAMRQVSEPMNEYIHLGSNMSSILKYAHALHKAFSQAFRRVWAYF